MLLSVLISGDKLEEARPYMVEMLAEHPDKAGHVLRQIYPLLAQHPDKEGVYKLVADLVQPYADVMEMHLVLAQAAAGTSNPTLALAEVRKARQLRPDSGEAAQLEAQLLYKEAPQQGLALLYKFLAAHPDVGDTRLTYARMLLAQKKYAESREQFKLLLAAHPKNPDSAFAVAMLSLEMGDLDLAEHALHQSLDNGKKDASTVYFHLGQLSETRKRDAEALQNYRLVTDGDNAYAARLRVVYLLYKAGQLDEAREYLRQTGVRGEQQRVQVTLAEAQLLRDAKQPGAAYDVLEQGMRQLPDNPELMYEAALMAEPLGKLEAFEQLLRKVIAIKPDYAQAYNALGYSLLDRNVRLQEGMKLVEKANQLAPEDAGIIDSMGWGHYRLGNLSKSLEFLQRAVQVNPDPEIVAHLGEVLWVQGDHEQALKVWGESLKAHPDNPLLQAVMKKFMP